MNTEKKKDLKNEIIQLYRIHDKDSGSTAVQIGLLFNRINKLTEHCQKHKKDKHSLYGLKKMVSKNKKCLKFLSRTNSTLCEEIKENHAEAKNRIFSERKNK